MHREVLFLVPSKITLPFFTRLYAECESEVFKRFDGKCRPILRAVGTKDGESDEDALAAVLERELQYGTDFKAVVVCPNESKSLTARIQQLSVDNDLHVVALTLPFKAWPTSRAEQNVADDRHARPRVVLCNSGSAVRQLAEAAIGELAYLERKSVHAVLIPGSERRSDSRFRLRVFKASLQDECKKNGLTMQAPVVLPACNWDREVARDAFLSASRNCGRVDVVFATNDEMALGARDAILQLCHDRKMSNQLAQCQIYGFDGIPEARTLLNHADPFFKGTVLQDYKGLAKQLGDVLDASPKAEPRVCPVEAIVKLQKRTKGRHFILRYPNIPPIDESSLWIVASDVARDQGVSVDALKKARDVKRGGDKRDDNYGKLGRDSQKRIWRKAKNGKIYYMAETL